MALVWLVSFHLSANLVCRHCTSGNNNGWFSDLLNLLFFKRISWSFKMVWRNRFVSWARSIFSAVVSALEHHNKFPIFQTQFSGERECAQTYCTHGKVHWGCWKITRMNSSTFLDVVKNCRCWIKSAYICLCALNLHCVTALCFDIVPLSSVTFSIMKSCFSFTLAQRQTPEHG